MNSGYFFIANNNLGYFMIGITTEDNCPLFFKDFKIFFNEYCIDNLLVVFEKYKYKMNKYNCIYSSKYYLVYETKLNNIEFLFEKLKI